MRCWCVVEEDEAGMVRKNLGEGEIVVVVRGAFARRGF